MSVTKWTKLQVRRAGVTAATALLGTCVATLLTLLPLESVSGVRQLALIVLAAAVPLLSYSVSVEWVGGQTSHHVLVGIAGAVLGVAGFALALLHLSWIAALVFVAMALLTLALSLGVKPQD